MAQPGGLDGPGLCSRGHGHLSVWQGTEKIRHENSSQN